MPKSCLTLSTNPTKLAWVLRHSRQLRLDPHHAEVLLRRRQRPRLQIRAQAHAGVEQHGRAVAVQHAAKRGGRRGGSGGVR